MPQQLQVEVQESNGQIFVLLGNYYADSDRILSVRLRNGDILNFFRDPKTQVWSNVTYTLTARVIGTN